MYLYLVVLHKGVRLIYVQVNFSNGSVIQLEADMQQVEDVVDTWKDKFLHKLGRRGWGKRKGVVYETKRAA